MTPGRLLLVEDHPDNLVVLKLLLSDRYQVLGFVSADDALTSLDSFKPDLLILDVAMAPIDGMQCLHMMRARPGFDGVPAIALTALAREVEKQTFLAAGFQAVVTKPVLDVRHLEATIDSLLKFGSF